MDDAELERRANMVSDRLQSARRLLFITGAGLSAESGLPTYRGTGGLYEDSDDEQGMSVEDALSGEVFEREPAITWKHIGRIEAACRGAQPNMAHRIMAKLESRYEVLVLTQNIDGFHRAAGSTNVIDIHGDCHRILCTRCSYAEERDNYEGMALPPHCPTCGAVMRPDVILFGERLPMDKLQRFFGELERGFDAYFSVGTSSLFPYIIEPMMQAARSRRLTIEINPDRTPISSAVEVHLACGAVRALSAVFPTIVR